MTNDAIDGFIGVQNALQSNPSQIIVLNPDSATLQLLVIHGYIKDADYQPDFHDSTAAYSGRESNTVEKWVRGICILFDSTQPNHEINRHELKKFNKEYPWLQETYAPDQMQEAKMEALALKDTFQAQDIRVIIVHEDHQTATRI